ncbi:MAG: hypothetical protein G01um101448_632 [Parcubacteria group bacterium Gr01-1014_48]|nr:MAG: hypothetical protein Greene041614_978 [Parcubacteria group bacterium Greene0416_14]TSC73685.1 MAG: hypothetical protein G01um101448_632 [Parcubacteria group bacterium Gr01-1014_48]TSD00265.1 MAG: hypothetical protein Greene101415_924 [Parcubacteria group bacterium Greene1014_15]TSD07497.1 MAG: hypothetical protein Greene07144_891 [Parcubacteria group bacterium Greene0714_4]
MFHVKRYFNQKFHLLMFLGLFRHSMLQTLSDTEFTDKQMCLFMHTIHSFIHSFQHFSEDIFRSATTRPFESSRKYQDILTL